MRNALINGGMGINQRAFAGGSLAAGVYGFDRWKAGPNGASLTASGATITLSSGAIVQVIEADTAAYMAGKSATFSVEDPSATISVAMAFSATDTTAVSGTIAAGSGRRGVTLALPAGTGNLTVTVSVSASTTFKRLQLELGAVATGWDARPIALEFQLCKRYCFRIQRGSVFAPTAVRGIMIVEYDPMRISPSATATGAVTITDTSNDYTQSAAGIVVSYLSTTGGQIYFDGFSGLTAYRIYIAHGSKGGAVILDAEL
ncbi:hypothetical protein [Pseudomonas oryzihabitans]|uniref:Uncharacterized protein n=1 Tax=Pseudomonas oryzihabitans TaxID=47885 RepID=A0A2Z5A9X6_9PSED|nr:hypothetical protein [Pseudomonas oryzihabitans]AXA66762.1 hypothetical protein CE139_13345 [Pseudomonas oryzihabitans]